MKKVVCLSTLACIMSLSAGSAFAGMSTITGGYAQGTDKFFKDAKGFKKPKGFNLKYRYEFDDSPWGVITSFTYNASDYSSRDELGKDTIKGQNFNLSAGPTYRINDWVSVYGLVGMSHRRLKASVNGLNDDFEIVNINRSLNKTGFTYGAGVQFNPMENLAVDFSYEQSHVKSGELFEGGAKSKANLGTFVLDVGYRF